MSDRAFDVGAHQLGSENQEPVAFCMLDFVGEPMFLHSSVGVIPWGGEDWYGLGQFGGLEPVQERLGYAPARLRLTLTQVAGQYLNDALNENTWGRLCELFVGNWSGTGLVRDPGLMIRGRMGPVEARIGSKNAGLALPIEDVRATLDRVNGLRAIMADHQISSSGDTFYEWLPKMLDFSYVFNSVIQGGVNVIPAGPWGGASRIPSGGGGAGRANNPLPPSTGGRAGGG